MQLGEMVPLWHWQAARATEHKGPLCLPIGGRALQCQWPEEYLSLDLLEMTLPW